MRKDKKSTDRVLAVDTSSLNMTVALWKNGKLLSEKTLVGAKHSHLLAHVLEGLFKKVKVRPEDLTRAAFGFGPGSYTGLRIGLASLKAFLLSQPRLRALGFSSLDLVASGIEKPLLGVVVDARREKIYCNFYRRQEGALERLFEKPLLLTIGELERELVHLSAREDIHLAGDALIRYGKALEKIKKSHFLPSAFWYPKARNAWPLIHRESDSGEWVDLRQVRPVYMRRSEAEEKWGLCYDERDTQYGS